MLIGTLCPAGWPRIRAWINVAAILATRSLMAQGPIRLAAEWVTIAQKFESEGLPNRFEGLM